MSRIVFNDRLDAALCVLFMFVVVSVLFYSVRSVLQARAHREPTAHETPFAALPAGAGGA
jgi:carbon starvation protein